jgi:hypothetical protein
MSNLTKIRRVIPNLVKIAQMLLSLYMKIPSEFQIAGSDVCGTKLHFHGYSVIRVLSTLLTAIYVGQQYKGQAMLLFRAKMVARTRHNITSYVHGLLCRNNVSDKRTNIVVTSHELL